MTGPDDTETKRAAASALISAAIEATGRNRPAPLSVRQFARLIHRNPRSIYRWLGGRAATPRSVLDQCAELLALSPAELREKVNEWIVRDFDNRQRSKSQQEQA